MSSRRLTTLLALATLVAMLGACGSGGVDFGTGLGGTGSTGGTGATGGSGGTSAAPFLGRWWRLLIFNSGGATRTTETTWDFRADGTATRTLLTSNVSDGIADLIVWQARWRQVGSEVEITYTSPVQGPVRFRWSIERGANGEVLYLDETWFQRLP